MPDTAPEISIDIVSDVVCPWCIIGYRQLERAIGTLGDRARVTVRWHPFELVPGMAPEGQNTRDYMRERYGATHEQSHASRDKMVGIGQGLGIDFRFGDESRIYNTHQAHQLLTWSADSGRQTALKLALFDAYFTQQANVSNEDVLLAAVEQAGLDRNEAAAVLSDGRYADAVTTEIDYWHDQNVTGVPAYIINGKYMVPGAQDAETFGRILERVIEQAP
ncbi:MAG: DsbA family oxidoreductase [Sphingomonadaceae bacterium]